MLVKNGFEIPFTNTAIAFASTLLRFLALLFGTYPYSFMVFIIFSFVSRLISGWLLIALETVLTPTPHILAISFIVGSNTYFTSTSTQIYSTTRAAKCKYRIYDYFFLATRFLPYMCANSSICAASSFVHASADNLHFQLSPKVEGVLILASLPSSR